MDICKGMPLSPHGHAKPCPLRGTCWRYEQYVRKVRPSGSTVIQGPYDFEDDVCGMFVER